MLRLTSRGTRPRAVSYANYAVNSATRGRQQRRHLSSQPPASLLNKPHLIPTLKLNIRDVDITNIPKLLKDRIDVAPSFYYRVPVIIDLDGVKACTSAELNAAFDEIRKLNVFPVGVCNASAELQEAARDASIPVLLSAQKATHTLTSTARPKVSISVKSDKQPSPPPQEPQKLEPQKPEPTQQQTESNQSARQTTSSSDSQPSQNPVSQSIFETIVIDKSIRSGQVVYGKDANLIIFGSIHSGAEVLADGDICVFGHLAGRALAGISGHTKAKVVTSHFCAELVSIANVYRIGDEISLERDRPAAIWLENGQLQYCNFSNVTRMPSLGNK